MTLAMGYLHKQEILMQGLGGHLQRSKHSKVDSDREVTMPSDFGASQRL